MVRVLSIAVVLLIVVLSVGLLLPWLVKGRALSDRDTAKNSLRELSQFAIQYTEALGKNQPVPADFGTPSATIVNPKLEPTDRLSWVVTLMPLFNQKRQPTPPILEAIQMNQPWNSELNQIPSRTVLRGLICPAKIPKLAANDPGVTQFVGLAGVGTDAATLPGDSLNSGAFRYDEPTPFRSFTDGLGYTIMFAETDHKLGPWIRGGPATTRGVDPGQAIIGVGAQFGGIHVGGANVAFADGSSKFLSDKISPVVFSALATRAGGATELGNAD